MAQEPKVAGTVPKGVDVEEGKTYFWCTCGHSKTQPFCDGAHKTEACEFKSLKYTADKTGKVFFCTCKKTKNPPFCDGAHSECV